MTKDELTALRREREKQELNIGDKVIVHSASDKPLYDGKVATIIEKGISGNEVYYGLYIEGVIVEKRSKPLIGVAGIIGTTSLLAPFYAEDLELVKEPTDEIKCGDRVNTPEGVFIVDMIIGDNIFGHYESGNAGIWTKKGLNKHKSANNKDNTIPVKVDLDDTYWDAYHAELVKELAVKLAHDTMLFPAETAERVVRYADAIVDNLKK